MSNLEALHAVITRNAGTYTMTVSDVEIGTAPDLVVATNRLCTEAAKHHRRVLVQVITRSSVQNLEIDEVGHIRRTAPPAPTTANPDIPKPVSTPAPAPAAAPLTATPRPPSTLVYKASLPGAGDEPGTPAGSTVKAPVRVPRRLTRAALARRATLAASVAAVSVAASVQIAGLSATVRAQQRTLQALPAVPAATLAGLRAQLRPPTLAAGVEAVQAAAAARHVQVSAVTSSPATVTAVPSDLGAIPDTTVTTTLTLTGTRKRVAAVLGQLNRLRPLPQLGTLALTGDPAHATATLTFTAHTVPPPQ